MNTVKVLLFLVTQNGGLQQVPHDFKSVEECKATLDASFNYTYYKDPYTTNSKRIGPTELPLNNGMCVVVKSEKSSWSPL